jgi:hypothetical protein
VRPSVVLGHVRAHVRAGKRRSLHDTVRARNLAKRSRIRGCMSCCVLSGSRAKPPLPDQSIPLPPSTLEVSVCPNQSSHHDPWEAGKASERERVYPGLPCCKGEQRESL